MEKSSPVSTVQIRVNINCCNACATKVKKSLLKVTGVSSVDVDREKRLVYVTGNADSKLLIKAIEKRNKKAEIVSNETSETPRQSMDQDYKKANYVKDEHRSNHVQFDDGNGYLFPTNGFGNEVCRDPHCQNHGRNESNNFPDHRPMPPSPYYPFRPSAPEMRFSQDEFGYPPMPLQGNYPGYGGTYLGLPRPWMR